jgi:hypothetical protein
MQYLHKTTMKKYNAMNIKKMSIHTKKPKVIVGNDGSFIWVG